RCEDSAGRNVEALDAFFDHPVAGGAYGPDLRACGLQCLNEAKEFGEDVALDLGGEEGCGCGAHVGVAEAAIDLNHFSADGELGDLASEIGLVALVEPGN